MMIKERNIRSKTRRIVTDEILGASSNKLTRIVKDIKYNKDFEKLTLSELQYILETTTNKETYMKVLPVYNRMASRYNKVNEDKVKWYNKGERSEKGIKQSLEENRRKGKELRSERQKKDIEYLIDATGVGKHQGLNFYTVYKGVVIPNPAMIGFDIAKKIKQVEQTGKRTGADEETIKKAIEEVQLKYQTFISEIKKNNRAKAKIINDKSLKYINEFLFEHSDSKTKSGTHAGYFGNVLGMEVEKEKLKALMMKLNTQERSAVMDMLRSNEFLRVWCSDQDSSCYDAEFREARLDEAISIIENYIGEGTQYDPATDSIVFYELNKNNSTESAIKLESYL